MSIYVVQNARVMKKFSNKPQQRIEEVLIPHITPSINTKSCHFFSIDTWRTPLIALDHISHVAVGNLAGRRQRHLDPLNRIKQRTTLEAYPFMWSHRMSILDHWCNHLRESDPVEKDMHVCFSCPKNNNPSDYDTAMQIQRDWIQRERAMICEAVKCEVMDYGGD
ncbi:hypothetical protein VNO77_01910 [Canavalia gladiata]|uniref:Uncharacterized protein n=1 Tax=Canavalia gladiata TaxID=3824 RepID=A0AAN9MSS0_CANGL